MRISVVTRPKPDKAGTLPLYVRVAHGGVKRYVSLGLRVPERDWNPRKQEVRASNPRAAKLNKVLAERLSAAQDAALSVQASGRHFTAERVQEAVQAALNPEPEPQPEAAAVPLLFDYLNAALDGYLARGEVSTALAYRSGVRHLARYFAERGNERPAFDDLTTTLARAWHAKLVRSYKPNTVHKYVSGVKTMVGQAAADDVAGAEVALKALRALKLKKERVEKERLTMAQVQALWELEGLKGRAADVREWYAFAFYAGGMRMSDVCLLRWSSVDRTGKLWRVRWRQKKTTGGNSLPVLSAAQEVLERWYLRTGPGSPDPSPFVFGLLTEDETRDPMTLRSRISSWNSLANDELYALQRAIGAPETGFHSARHSVADHLRKSGVDIYTISKVLGHANIRITENYLKSFDSEDLDAKLGRAFGTPPPEDG